MSLQGCISEVLCLKGFSFSLQVIVLLAESKDFEFVLGDRRDVLVVNAIKLNLGSHVSAAAWFPIRPVALGEVEISVDAVCAEASDRLVWRVLVKVWNDGSMGSYLCCSGDGCGMIHDMLRGVWLIL